MTKDVITELVVGATWTDCQRRVESIQDRSVTCTATMPKKEEDGKWYSTVHYILKRQ